MDTGELRRKEGGREGGRAEPNALEKKSRRHESGGGGRDVMKPRVSPRKRQGVGGG